MPFGELMRISMLASRRHPSRWSGWQRSAAAWWLALLLISVLSGTARAATAPDTDSEAAAGGSVAQAEAEPSLGAFLDAQGHLQLPSGFSGSVNPGGYRIVSGEGEALRFAPDVATSDGSGWNGYGGIADGCNGIVRAIAIGGSGEIYVGGSFTLCGSASANGVARFDTGTQTWTSLGSGAANGVSGVVLALAVAGNTVYAGGDFTQAGGAPANRVARFDSGNQTWASLGSGVPNGVNNFVHALAISGSTVYVGGDFTQAGGALANRVARFDTDTQTWSSLGNGAANGVDSTVWTLAISGSTLYAGGSFTQAGSAPANRVARFDTASQMWASLGTGTANGVNGVILALAVSSTTVYAGGDFTQAGGAPANRMARFDSGSQSWSSLGGGTANGVNGLVRALVVSDAALYLGGDFIQAGGASANRVARFDLAGQTWAPLGTGASNGVSGQVFALKSFGSHISVGGGFSQAGSVPANRVALFETSSQTWVSLGGRANGVNNWIYSLVVSGNTVYLGGDFNQAGGMPANRVARYETNTQTWASLGSGANNGVNDTVLALAISDNTLYVGGRFTQAGSVNANRVASFDLVTENWSSLGSGAANGVSGGIIQTVRALVVSGNTLYAAGAFTQAGGAVANNIARFDTETRAWASLGSDAANGLNNQAWALAISGRTIYVGGGFNQAGGVLANGVARFDAVSQTWASLGSGAANGVTEGVTAVAASGNMIYVGGSFGQAGGMQANRVARFDIASQTWSTLGFGVIGNGVNNTVYNLVVSGNAIYAGGDFTLAGGIPSSLSANRVARFDTTTQTWASLSSGTVNGTSGSVRALAASDSGTLYVGGSFSSAGGQPSSNFASYREEQVFNNGFEPAPR